MRTRYQVFVSSTYSDLKEERSKVIKGIMDLDCIPAGMEMFPAIDEEQFEFIKRVIDDCDYYILIIGGRYGSMTESGISYTEMEFDYAMSKQIPVIALLHNDINNIPAGKVDMDSTAREKLERFREKVKRGRLVRFWNTPENLIAEVIVSLSQTIRMRPGIGWVRANVQTNTESLQELNDLRKEIEKLREYKSRNEATFEYTPNIADWDEMFTLHLEDRYTPLPTMGVHIEKPVYIEKSWEEWFRLIITDIQRREYGSGSIKDVVANVVRSLGEEYWQKEPVYEDILTMGYQFTSYGVIEVVSSFDEKSWRLTSKGKKVYAQMMCVRSKKRAM